MSKIIAFAGMKSAGKSTAVNFFVSNGYRRLAFGDVLKDVVAILFGVDRAYLEGDTPMSREWRERINPFWNNCMGEALGQDITPRVMLQLVGEGLRQVYPDIWVDALRNRVEEAQSHGLDIVISDLRHISEWRALESWGATSIGVYRKLPKWVPTFYREAQEHLEDSQALHAMTKQEDAELLAKLRDLPVVRQHKIHTSEWQHLLLPLHGVVRNSGTIQDLHKKLETLL